MISFLKRSSERIYAASKVCGAQLAQTLTLFAFACLCNAAELGELRVYSTLGEPLKAEIELVNTEDIAEEELEVKGKILASFIRGIQEVREVMVTR